ncbi:EF-hand domain-containing protein [Paraburkholderia heleia]|uniref:EF-hand domain-containing protein n=1 Tax=Paraburkholderia heleia TaxID=634127 RepID=UPI0005A6803C|nr:EF-hand domain-containing protein [Paraburkholderia heleia]
MKRIVTRACIVLPGILAAAPIIAQSTISLKLEARFAAADVDHDGKLTRAEAQAGLPLLAGYFDEIDSTRQGYVTLAQIEQYVAQRCQ